MRLKAPAALSLPFKQASGNADTVKERKLRNACADFEAIILEKMISQARKANPKGGLFDGGFGEEIYRSMQDHELAQKLAHGKGMGLGELLYRQISRQHPLKTR